VVVDAPPATGGVADMLNPSASSFWPMESTRGDLSGSDCAVTI
jgi:hypothetical protein